MGARRVPYLLVLVTLAVGLASGAPSLALTQEARDERPNPVAGRSSPLEVPTGLGSDPESLRELPVDERIATLGHELGERGFETRPLLALALLDAHPGTLDPDVVERVVALAGDDPGVRFEIFRRRLAPGDLVGAVSALGGNVPAALWGISIAGLAAGAGLCALCVGLIGAGFVRALRMHGHVIGHRLHGIDPPAWPGVLLLLTPLAALPLLGLGPALILSAAGGLACMRLDLRFAVAIATALALSGVALGPGVGLWSRVAAHYGDAQALRAAWRVDRAQPLPGDLEQLVRATERDPEDAFMTLALATGRKRVGDVEGALEALDQLSDVAPRSVYARAANLRGVLRLARGELTPAVDAFERARAVEETAAVLYNLSQAYARGMRLVERSAIFSAARDLDPDLVTHYTAFEGANVHRFVIQDPLPEHMFLARAVVPSAASRSLVRRVRQTWLGRGAPELAWLALPFAALLGIAIRRSSLRPCDHCRRPVCSDCTSIAHGSRSCNRCERLYVSGATTDPRLRRIQLHKERARLRRRTAFASLLSLLVPGILRVLDGRIGSGTLRLVGLGAGLALALGYDRVARPIEIGALSHVLPLGLGATMLAFAYLSGAIDAFRHASGRDYA